MTRLQEHWQAVLATFFPRWKAGSQWRCTTQTRRSGHGYCDRERRVIEIGKVLKDDDALDALLIHEMSHAVASEGHGRIWQRRIELTADVARRVGRPGLAELLKAEIVEYQERAEHLSPWFEKLQPELASQPDLTFVQIKRELAKEFNLLVSDVEKKFRGLRRLYKKAHKEALDNQKAHKEALDNQKARKEAKE